MSDPRQALLTAIYQTLADDTELTQHLSDGEIYDHAPRGAQYPFVSFGECRSRSLDADTPRVDEHRFEVLVHSRALSRSEASAIANRIAAVLDGAPPAAVGVRIDSLRHRESTLTLSRDQRAYRVRMVFVAVTELE